MKIIGFKPFFAGLGTLVLLDSIWLGWLAAATYKRNVGHLLANEPNWAAALTFYPLYTAGVLYFALHRNPDSTTSSAIKSGALLGAFAYGTYDLTNLATLRDWPVGLSIMDMTWGVIVTAAVATVAQQVNRRQ